MATAVVESDGDGVQSVVGLRKRTICQQNAVVAEMAVDPDHDATAKKLRSSYYWLAHHRQRVLLRHAFMVLMIAAIGCSGAYIVLRLERDNEHVKYKATIRALEEMVDEETEKLMVDKQATATQHIDELREWYKRMLKKDGRWEYSAYATQEDPDRHLKWTFGGSLFYWCSITSTIGYGSIACVTTACRVFTIIGSLIFVPMTIIWFRFFGQYLLDLATRLYGNCILKPLVKLTKRSTPDIIRLPRSFSAIIALSFFFALALLIQFYDGLFATERATTQPYAYLQYVYFLFCSMSLVGFGDVMPVNVPFSPLVMMFIFVGLAILKVVCRSIFVSVENGMFGTLTVMENRLFGVPDGTTTPVAAARRRRPTNVDAASPSATADAGHDEEREEENENPHEWLNQQTIHSIYSTFMRANRDVYSGHFGRVAIKGKDVMTTGGAAGGAQQPQPQQQQQQQQKEEEDDVPVDQPPA